MKKRNDVVSKGKFLALLLRHKPEEIGLSLDEHGWADVSFLVKSGHFTKELLDEIVSTNNKKRYEYNENETKIRARQGHSIEVDLELEPTEPPDVLYHGTQTKFLDSILMTGINKGSRHDVHLSDDIPTAINVGNRRGNKTIVLKIDSKKMYDDGYKFYVSNNGVWLIDFVPRKYITII